MAETVNCLLLVLVLNIIVPVNSLDNGNCDISIKFKNSSCAYAYVASVLTCLSVFLIMDVPSEGKPGCSESYPKTVKNGGQFTPKMYPREPFESVIIFQALAAHHSFYLAYHYKTF